MTAQPVSGQSEGTNAVPPRGRSGSFPAGLGTRLRALAGTSAALALRRARPVATLRDEVEA
ncbi:hypothetical protein [Streptomyces chromofuscus]|uniref:hypothetical protein n=1 Tax=Streptomyces chromofuscus TaxID=42881 RepID=UPI0016740519|nr:hypothetical protein [Streptomyces chromofuscus]GGT04210.1 hypothetical protein GCM10010254_25770 [Streptomyces chromofuscus]